MTDAFPMLGILTDTNVDLVVVDDRGGYKMVFGPLASQNVFCILGIAIELPEQVAPGRLETVDPTIAAWKNDLWPALDGTKGRAGPLTVHDLVAG